MITVVVGALGVFAPMLCEQGLSLRHERALRQIGAAEPAGDVFRPMAVAYPSCFAAMIVEAGFRGAPHDVWLWLGGLVFLAGKALKYWAMATLGERWSFRVLVVPGSPLVASGPYRWFRHPNYVGVLGELAGAALWFGAWASGPAATLAFAGLMWKRVRIEDRALSGAASPGTGKRS